MRSALFTTMGIKTQTPFQVLALEASNIPACFLGSAQTSNVMGDIEKGKFR